MKPFIKNILKKSIAGLFLFLALNSNANRFRIELISDSWETKNYVEFAVKNTDTSSSSKQNKKKTGPGFFATKRWVCNTGHVKSEDAKNTWTFDRDSAMRYLNGEIILILFIKSGKIEESDTLDLWLPLIKRIDIDFERAAGNISKKNIFDNALIVELTNDKKTYYELNFNDPNNILYSVTIKTNLKKYVQENSLMAEYEFPENIYPTAVWVEFTNKYTNSEINKLTFPKSVYIHRAEIKMSGKNGLSDDGTNGKKFVVRAIADTSLYASSDIINGTDGADGQNGENGKDVKIRITRVSKTDSMAKIVCTLKDGTITKYVDIIHGGSVVFYSQGGSGGEGGDGGTCGSIKLKDKTDPLIFGKTGKPGKGGNGGNGGNIIIEIDKIYKNYATNIEAINSGGQGGFGGYDPSPCCYCDNPYKPSKTTFSIIGSDKTFGGNKHKIEAEIKSNSRTDLAPAGKPGIDGKVTIRFF